MLASRPLRAVSTRKGAQHSELEPDGYQLDRSSGECDTYA
jgi:hypothetical protein